MDSDVLWRMKYKGKPITIYTKDLSLRRMMEMRARYGEPYGIFSQFVVLLGRGDMIALACAIWIGQQTCGLEVESLDTIDFSLDDLEPLEDPKPEKKAKGGKKADPTTDHPTTDSTSTASRSSETDTSSTSETSSD